MTRVVGFLVRNWPLKIAAVLLATLLYAGLVLSQSARVWPGSIPIAVVNQPSNLVLMEDPGEVSDIRFVAPADVAARISTTSFTATVDLSGVVVESGNPYVYVAVVVKATDSSVQVYDFRPNRVPIRLDALIDKTVPVEVDRGTLPEGLAIGEPGVSATSATASGPESVVRLVSAAVARIRIQPTGVDFDQEVDLVAVDARGETLDQVQIEPASVHVRASVGSTASSRSLPVEPVLTGAPADGIEIIGVSAQPLVVSVSGDADILGSLERIQTRPVSVAGARADFTRTVALDLPEGLSAGGVIMVRVTVDVHERTGTRGFQVGIAPTGARSDRVYRLAVDQAVVTLGGTIGDLNAVDAARFFATVDVSQLGVGTFSIPVAVTPPVAGLEVVAIGPAAVSVSVTALETPSPSPAPTPSPEPTPGL